MQVAAQSVLPGSFVQLDLDGLYQTGETALESGPLSGQSYSHQLAAATLALSGMGIVPRTVLCGRVTPVRAEGRTLRARSLMLAGMTPAQAIELQRQGLGAGRRIGCGLFVPHKSIGDLSARPD